MSDAPLTAPIESGTAQTPAQPELQAHQGQPNLDDISSAWRSGDIAKIREIRQKLENPSGNQSGQPSQSEQPQIAERSSTNQQTDPAQQLTPDQKKFRYKYKGEDREVDNSDGYLGTGSFGKLQKSFVHTKLYAEDLERETAKVKADMLDYRTKAEALEKQNKEMQEQLKQAQTRVSINPSVSTPTQQAQAQEDIPDAPQPPQAEFNPFDEDSISEYKAYWKADADYKKVLVKKISDLATKTNRPSAPDDAIRQDIELLKKERENERIQNERSREQDRQAEQIRREWDGRRKFQDMHQEFKTDRPLQELHQDVLTWMDRVAFANGIRQPNNPDQSSQEWQAYNAQRGNVIFRFLQNDAEVVSKSDGFDPPKDYDKYFKLAEIETYRNKKITEGELGPKADLHAAWRFKVEEDGTLGEMVENVERESQARGSKAVIDAIKGTQQEYATPIPNNAGSGAVKTEMTADQERDLMLKNPYTMTDDERTRLKEIISRRNGSLR